MTSAQGQRRTPNRTLIAVGVWVAYGLAYGPLHGLLGTHAGVSAFLPVVLTAWHLGATAGALSGLTAVPITMLAAFAAGVGGANWLTVPALTGAAAMVMVGYSIGHIRDLRTEAIREVTRREQVESTLDHERRRLSIINEIAGKLRGNRSVVDVISEAVSTLHQHFPQFRTSYSTVGRDGQITILSSVEPGEELVNQATTTPFVLTPQQVERLVHTDLYEVTDVSTHTAWGDLSELLSRIGTAALLDAPLPHPGVTTGLLAFSSSAAHAWTDIEKQTLRDAADCLAPAIEDAERQRLLKESESRSRTMLDEHLDGVAVVADGQFLYVNHVLARMFGYEREDLVDRDPLVLLRENQRSFAAERMRGLLADGAPALIVEYSGLKKDGTTFPLEILSRKTDHDGQAALIGVFRDLTERRRTASALREAEAKYRSLVESSLSGIYIVQDRRFVYVNPKLAEIMGYEQSELLELPDALAAVVEEDREGTEQKVEARLSGTSGADHFYVHARRKSGEVIELEIHGGTTTYMERPAIIGTALDVTDRRHAEERLVQSELRFRALFEEAPIGLVMAATDTRIQQVNQAFCDMLGYSKSELVGRTMDNITHPEDVTDTPQSAAATSFEDTRHVIRWHKRYMRKDGTAVQAETTVSTVRYRNGRPEYTVAMIEDVTEQRKLEDQLHQVLRLESVGQLAGGVAHNFNNALTAISGYSELLAHHFDAEDPALRDLQQIQRVAEQSAHLTHQLLTFSRREHVHPTVFNINEAVESSRDLLSPLLGDALRIRLRLGQELPRVRSDRSQLEQVITNLVLNARDAMPEGGLLTIETNGVVLDSAGDQVNPEARPGRYVRLIVGDSGIGMPKETIAHIFEPFFTTKEPGEGVGLGLAMVHGAVKQNGGFITVESTPQVGSTFTVLLPEFDEHETGKQDPIPPAHAVH